MFSPELLSVDLILLYLYIYSPKQNKLDMKKKFNLTPKTTGNVVMIRLSNKRIKTRAKEDGICSIWLQTKLMCIGNDIGIVLRGYNARSVQNIKIKIMSKKCLLKIWSWNGVKWWRQFYVWTTSIAPFENTLHYTREFSNFYMPYYLIKNSFKDVITLKNSCFTDAEICEQICKSFGWKS